MKKGSRTKFKIKGLNQERTLNKLSKSTKIYNLKRVDQHFCQFETDFSKRKIAKKILLENGMEILHLSHSGILSKIKRLVTSYGLILALGVCSLFYGLQYQYIWKIEIVGEAQLQEGVLKDFINQTLPSKIKSKIDTKGLERAVKEEFPEVSSLSIAIVGQALVLNINEGVLPEEMEGEYQPLKSEYDGLITQIQLVQGTLAVNEGQLVKAGDVLVYPYVYDSEGEEIAVSPKAEIWADVWLAERGYHYDYQIVVERTGRVAQAGVVMFNNLPIYRRSPQIQFEEYEVEEEIVDISKNLFLPLKLKRTIFYQTRTQEIISPFEGKKEEIIASLREKTLIFVQENEIIKEENYTIREEGGCYEICYITTVNRNIGG